MTVADLDLGRYQLGWSDTVDYALTPDKGLNEDVVREISWWKGEPPWMTDFRLKSLRRFEAKPVLGFFMASRETLLLFGSPVSGVDDGC